MGSSFDPPHKGHYQIVSHVLSKNIFDEVWLVPAKIHAFDKSLSDENHRLEMLKLFIHDFKKKPIKIETYELEKKSTSYSYETLSHFARKQPLDKFSWIIGSDNLANFPKWNKYLELLQRFTVYVYPRPNYPMKHLQKGMIPLKKVKEKNISSTEIRAMAKDGKDITDLVGLQVAKYINLHKLYKN